MEALKRNLFWVLTGGVLLFVLVFYPLMVFVPATKNRGREKEIVGEAERLAATKPTVNKSFETAAGEYREWLKGEYEQVVAKYKTKLIDTSDLTEDRLRSNKNLFEEDLQKLCQKICEETELALGKGACGVNMADSTSWRSYWSWPASLLDTMKTLMTEDPTIGQIQGEIKKRFAVAREIHKILCAVSVDVPYETLEETDAVGGGGVSDFKETPGKEPRKVEKILSVSFSGAEIGKEAAAGPEEFARSREVELRFRAHYALVWEVVKRMEASKVFFIIKDIQMKRPTSEAGLTTTKAISDRQWIKRELPIDVTIKADAIEFEFQDWNALVLAAGGPGPGK